MGDDFKLPPGNTFPSPERTLLGRPRRRSIDTPNLKLDTATVTVSERFGTKDFPPPPKMKSKIVETVKIVEKQVVEVSQPDTKTEKTSTNANNDGTTPIMRSMFPPFESDRGKIQQSHLALVRSKTTPTGPSIIQHSPSLYSQPQSPPQALIAGDPWAASRIPSILFHNSPLRFVEDSIPDPSTPEQLLDLWSLALGQDAPEAFASYTLGVKCNSLRRNHESIGLASTSTEIYSIHASGPSVAITRKHPLNPSNSITVTTPSFRQPTTTSPVLAGLCPTSAESEALDTATEIATQNRLAQSHANELQAEAVTRARQKEAGALLWDSDSSSYYFTLPMLNVIPGSDTIPAALPIEIIPDALIRFLDGESKPLLALNLVNNTLTVNTKTITALSSSPHALDIIMSALLTLALHLHHHEGILKQPGLIAPHFDPPPKFNSDKRGSTTSRIKTVKSSQQTPLQTPVRWLSRLNPLSSRASTRASHQTYPLRAISTPAFEKDIELGSTTGDSAIILPHHIPPMTQAPIPPHGIAPELLGSNTGVDLSKFQAFDLQDPDLSQGVKLMLRLLYWGFSVTVWILGVFVGVLAASIVAIGACFGGGTGSREG